MWYRCPWASICFQHCEGPKSLPSPAVTSPFLLFASLPLSSFPSPLEVAPLIQLGGQWGLGRSPSRQRFWCILRVNERCWYVGRGRWVMHDGMPYDPIQGQGHETFKVRNSLIFFNFQNLSPPAFLTWAGKWPLFLAITFNKRWW